MKRYERMSKEGIISMLNIAFNNDYSCADCKIKECRAPGDRECGQNILEYLNKDIQAKPRIFTIKTLDDLQRVDKEFEEFCFLRDCAGCAFEDDKYRNCLLSYLKEEIEVLDED